MPSFCKEHLITFGAVFMLLTFGLFGTACAVSNLFSINLHLNQDMIPNFHASPVSTLAASFSSHPLTHPALIASVSKLAQASTFDVRADTTYSYFRYCYDFSLDVVNVHPYSNQTDAFHLAIPYDCKTINPSCTVDLRSIVYDIAAMLGQNVTDVPQEVMDMLKSAQILQNCDQYNASRGFAAMSCIISGLGLLFAILLWRKKLTLTPFAVTSFIVACFAVVAISLLIATEQSDPAFANIGLIQALIPGMISMGFGIGFIPLVAAAFCALVTGIICAIEMWDRSQGGHVNPFTLQAHPESGILESHISMYQQM